MARIRGSKIPLGYIANATELPRLYRLLEDLQLPRILVCTPIQFLGDPDDDI
jgi:hypothetical protein